MGKEFLHDLNIHGAGQIQFKTSAGANAGKIDQNGNNLVLTNAVGDILLGDGAADIYIGDGANNVDILFEQSGNIKADDSASNVTLTLGSSNTTLNLISPNITGSPTLSATTINNKLTFTTANGYILFDHEPSGDTGAYEGTTSVPLLKVDRSGNEMVILERVSEYGALLLGNDDSVIIAGGDTRNTLRSNINESDETVIVSAEGGMKVIGFPNNMSGGWSARQEFRFYTGGSDASSNGLWIGSGGNTQFIDLNRNLKNIGTISSGAITSTGKLTINTGSDDILTLNQTSTDTKWNYINFNNQGTREWFIGQDSDGNFDLYNDNINAYAITVSLSDNSIVLNDNVNVAGNLVLNSNSNIVAARKFTARDSNGVMLTADDATSGLSIADSGAATFTGNVVVGNDLYVPNEIYHTGDTDTSIRFPAEDQFRVMTGGGNRLQVENTKIQVGDDVNMNYDNISTGNSGTVVYGGFLNPASEANMVHIPHIVNDLAGFNKWSNATITTSGFYKSRSGSSGSYTYSNEVQANDSGWANAFDAHSSTAGSWYSDNGSDGIYQHGTDTPGVVELEWTNEATYSLWAGIVFGSNSFTATYVKIEAYRGGAWQTLCEITDNTDQVILRQVGSNSGTGSATTRLKYTLGGSVNNSYFRIHSLYMVNYAAGNNNLNNTGTDTTRGVNFLERYKDGYLHGHLYPGADDTYNLGSSSYKWRNSYFDGVVYADRVQSEGVFPQQNIIDTPNGGGASRTMQVGMSGTSMYFKKSDATGNVYFRNTNNTNLMTIGLADTGQVTVLNELEAGSLDINGNADISGNITVGGTVDGVDIAALATANTGDQDLSAYATLASPTFTGTPAAPTAAAGTNTTQIATTAFVSTAVSNLVDSAPGTLDTLNELAAALGDDANFSTTVTDSIATKLPLAGGTMTGAIDFGNVTGRAITITGDSNLDSSDASIYLGNSPSSYGWDIKYIGSGTGNDNKLQFISTNLGSPVTALSFTQDGNATFAGAVTVNGVTTLGDATSDSTTISGSTILNKKAASGTNISIAQLKTANGSTTWSIGGSNTSNDNFMIWAPDKGAGNYFQINKTSGQVKIGADASGSDLIVYGNETGERMFWDASESNLTINHDTDDSGLEIYTVGSAQPTTHQLKVGRDANQYLGIRVDDGRSYFIHRQDESGGGDNHHQSNQIWTNGGGTHTWNWDIANNSGGSPSNKMQLNSSGNLTVAGQITSGRLNITDAAVSIMLTESGNTGTGKYWRQVLDAGDIRFDVDTTSTNGDGSFSSYNALIQLNADGHTDINGNLDVGGGIDVTGNITVSGTVDGRDVAADGTKLDGIAANANNYVHPTHDGDDININTSNAQVIDRLDIVTDTSGHVTDMAVATRDLTLANLGYTGATNADVTPSWVPSSDPSYLTSSSTQSKYLRSDTADTAAGHITFSDDVKAKFGTSGDLQIFHTSDNSFINDNGTGDLYIQTNGTNMFLRDKSSGDTFIAMNTGTADVVLKQGGNTKLTTTSTGISVTGDISMSGDIKGRSVPMVIHGSFDDTTSSTSNLIIPLAGSITETTVSGASAPHFFTIPYACVLKRVIMKTVSGSMSSSFTTELKAYKNGAVTGNSSSGELTHVSSSVTWNPTAHSDITYAAGDKFSLVYQKSATSKYWQDVAVTIVFTLTGYDI